MRMTKTNPLFTKSFLPHGNGKLLDYDDTESGIRYRYAQFNTRAIKDCPFRSKGCTDICYATKGNHIFKSVKESRENSFRETRSENFVEKMIYSVNYHLNSKRYKDAIMLLRIHESGDFYSLQYLKNWVKIWESFQNEYKLNSVFYTKSFAFFNMLNEEEMKLINDMMKAGLISINCSIDDTTTEEQMKQYILMLHNYPLCNTYRVTNKVKPTDDICDCANCAKCASCNKAKGKTKVVKIHSASNAEIEEYEKNMVERI